MNLVPSESSGGITNIIDHEKYSSFSRLNKITAYVMRFVNNLKAKKLKNQVIEGELTLNELQFSEKIWYKDIQATIRKGNKYDQLRISLNFVEDEDGILRCQGRLQNVPVDFKLKCRILLPGCDHLTKLIVLQCHQLVMHKGLRETLTQLRTKFWITRGYQEVKKIISKCVVCKKEKREIVWCSIHPSFTTVSTYR